MIWNSNSQSCVALQKVVFKNQQFLSHNNMLALCFVFFDDKGTPSRTLWVHTGEVNYTRQAPCNRKSIQGNSNLWPPIWNIPYSTNSSTLGYVANCGCTTFEPLSQRKWRIINFGGTSKLTLRFKKANFVRVTYFCKEWNFERTNYSLWWYNCLPKSQNFALYLFLPKSGIIE